MSVSGRTLTAALIAAFVACQGAVAADFAQGAVRIEVIDSSGGVLPGVTVTATATDGRLLAATVTDQRGGSVLSALPAGTVQLTFQLEGFD